MVRWLMKEMNTLLLAKEQPTHMEPNENERRCLPIAHFLFLLLDNAYRHCGTESIIRGLGQRDIH